MRFGPIPVGEAEGAILAHSVKAGGKTWRKAHRLTAGDIADLRAAGIDTVVAAVLEDGDLGENEAAARMAAALAADHIEIREAATGRVNLHARVAGVLRVEKSSIDAVNAIDPAMTLATLPDYSTVEQGRMVATVKIIPFAVSAGPVARAADAAAHGVLRLFPFRPLRAGLVQTQLAGTKPGVLDKTARLTAERLARSGSSVSEERRTAHEAADLAAALADLAAANELVLAFGASAVADEDDVIPDAVRRAGGVVERVGMPVDPGNLLVIGHIGGTTVIGAPGCARSPKLNGFDWVLDRIMAGLDVTASDIAAMGVGGLLMEIETRPQPREARTGGAGEVHAVLLAAGQGRRMGGPNKLLARFGGQSLVRRVADMLAASKVRGTVVVTGHDGERVRAALSGFDGAQVDNPDYASGIAGSLKVGVAALPAPAAGALIALGDMPLLTTADIDRLVTAFINAGGSSIVRATTGGKRGNPVILPRSLFVALTSLQGDTGARHLIEASGLDIVDVELGAAAGLDVDTPETLAGAGGELVD